MNAKTTRTPMDVAAELIATGSGMGEADRATRALSDAIFAGWHAGRRAYRCADGSKTSNERAAIVSWMDAAEAAGHRVHPSRR